MVVVDVVVLVVVVIVACRWLWEWGRAFVKPSALLGGVPPAVAGERPESTNRNQNPVEPPEVVVVVKGCGGITQRQRSQSKWRCSCQAQWYHTTPDTMAKREHVRQIGVQRRWRHTKPGAMA